MAIFAKVDYDLPLLTHMAQVDPDKDEELLYLCYVSSYQSDVQNKDEDEGQQPSRTDFDVGEWREYIDSVGLNRLREMCRLVQGVCSNLIDHGGVTADQQRALIKFTQEQQSYLVPPPPGVEYVALKDMTAQIPDYSISEWVWTRFSEYFIDALLSHRGSYHTAIGLKRCEECNGIFIQQDRPRRYCSHRCVHRVGVRRRRAKQAEHPGQEKSSPRSLKAELAKV